MDHMISSKRQPDGTTLVEASAGMQSAMAYFASSRLIKPTFSKDETGNFKVFPEYRDAEETANDEHEIRSYCDLHKELLEHQGTREGWNVIDPTTLTCAQSPKALDAIQQAANSTSSLIKKTMNDIQTSSEYQVCLKTANLAAIALYSADLNEVLLPIASSIYKDPAADDVSKDRVENTISRILSLDTLTRRHLLCEEGDISRNDKAVFTSSTRQSKTPAQIHQYWTQIRRTKIEQLAKSVRAKLNGALILNRMDWTPSAPDKELVSALTHRLHGYRKSRHVSLPATHSASNVSPTAARDEGQDNVNTTSSFCGRWPTGVSEPDKSFLPTETDTKTANSKNAHDQQFIPASTSTAILMQATSSEQPQPTVITKPIPKSRTRKVHRFTGAPAKYDGDALDSLTLRSPATEFAESESKTGLFNKAANSAGSAHTSKKSHRASKAHDRHRPGRDRFDCVAADRRRPRKNSRFISYSWTRVYNPNVSNEERKDHELFRPRA